MIDRRYVREIEDTMHAIEDWHEMLDAGTGALCGAYLDPGITMQFSNLAEPPRYQHQRGTGFPPGRTCAGCVEQREWLDLESKGPIYEDAERHS